MSQRLTRIKRILNAAVGMAGDVSVPESASFPASRNGPASTVEKTTEDAKAQVPARIKIGSQPG